MVGVHNSVKLVGGEPALYGLAGESRLIETRFLAMA